METKFTKGEWCNTNGIITQKGNIRKVIANTYANRFGGKEQKANAQLISAAPELLEALNELWEHTMINNLDAFFGNFSDDSVFGKVLLAIKKATE